MPEPDEDRETLGSAAAPPGDPASQGGEPGPADGIAGPSYPPAGTEPDAQGETDPSGARPREQDDD